jgi:hypothetical protein
MTITDLHTKVIDRPSHEMKDGKVHNNLDEINAEAPMGHDISGALHRAVHSKRGCAVFDTEPKVPLYAAFDQIIKSIHKSRKLQNKQLFLCFDGKQNPMKARTDAKREAARQKAGKELTTLYSSGCATLEQVEKQRALFAKPREDLIAMLVEYCNKNGIPKLISAASPITNICSTRFQSRDSTFCTTPWIGRLELPIFASHSICLMTLGFTFQMHNSPAQKDEGDCQRKKTKARQPQRDKKKSARRQLRPANSTSRGSCI